MDDEFLKDRQRGLEEDYFRKHDARLIEQMRERARREEAANSLREALGIDAPDVVDRVIGAGITRETAPALLLAPLVQVAWAEGSVTQREREVVLRRAALQGIADGSPARAQLIEWLKTRPSNALFDVAAEVVKTRLSHLPGTEREQQFKELIAAANEVAGASGGLARVLGLGSGISGEEESLLDAIATRLRGSSPSAGP